MIVRFKIAYKVSESRTIVTGGADLEVLGKDIPAHINLAWLLDDNHVSTSNKIEKLVQLGLVKKTEIQIMAAVKAATQDDFKAVAKQLLTAKFLPGIAATIYLSSIQPATQSAIVSSEGRVNSARLQIRQDPRVDEVINSIRGKNALDDDFRLIMVVSKDGAVAREYRWRFSGTSNVVVAMYAESRMSNGKTEQQLVAVRIPLGSSSGNRSETSWHLKDEGLRYEHGALQFLANKRVKNVTKPYKKGIYALPSSDRIVFVMEHAGGSDDRSVLQNISQREIRGLSLSVCIAIAGAHSNGITHGRIALKSLFIDPVSKCATLGNWKHAMYEGKKPPDHLQSKTSFHGVVDSKIQVVNDPGEFERKDCADLGALFMSFLSRDAINFDLENHIDQDISSILQTLCSNFNKCVFDETQKIASDGPFASIIVKLLKGQISAEDALADLKEWEIPQPFQLEGEVRLPAIFIPQERAMMYPMSLYKTVCIDQHGKEVQGVGAKAGGKTPSGAIIAKYTGSEISAQLSEHLRSVKKDSHLITGGPSRSVIINGDREDNGVFDLSYFIQNVEAASMINGPYNVSREYDREKKEHRTVVHKFQPNCVFQHRQWEPKARSYYPGESSETDTVLVRAIRELEEGEILCVDYGDQTAKKMFGVEAILKDDSEIPIKIQQPIRKRKSRSWESNRVSGPKVCNHDDQSSSVKSIMRLRSLSSSSRVREICTSALSSPGRKFHQKSQATMRLRSSLTGRSLPLSSSGKKTRFSASSSH